MKKLITFLLLSFSLLSFAGNWKVVEKEGFFLLVSDKNSELYYQIESNGGMPEFEEEKQYRGNIKLLIYNSGTAGTYVPITIKRALVWDEKSGKFLADLPYKYFSTAKVKLVQPKWEIKKETLIVNDQNTDEVWNINLPR